MITKGNTDLSGVDFSAGEVILIDKDFKWTSFHVVRKIRGLVKAKKVGHAGTLDPNATGLLIICTGKKTKEIEKYQADDKTYTGVIELGKVTPTMDTESEPSEVKDYGSVTEEKIEKARKKFLGKIKQLPPMYSALKYGGKALYKFARKGVEVKREPRDVEVHRFDITKIELPYIFFEINCSKGTYIRVIAHDIGQELGCGSYLKELRRTAIGGFSVNEALKVDEFGQLILNNKSS